MNTTKTTHPGSASLARLCRGALLAAATLFASTAGAQTTVYVLSQDGTELRNVLTQDPAAVSAPVTITGVNASETLVAIDVRPQNQQLYALGVNATANTATLYCLSPQTGFAGVVGTASSIAYVDGAANPIDFSDPAATGWDIDFNPAADRLRIVAGSLNCRVNPNTGLPVDGDLGGAAGSVAGVNPDGAINGGSTSVNGTAYTNNQPNNGGITTQYTLDAATNSLYIQNPPNAGTQTSGQALTFLNGDPVDFTGAVGFDIVPGVNAPSSNSPAPVGSGGLALLTVGGTTELYSINLAAGVTTSFGEITGRSIAVRTELGAAIAMSADGMNLLRFATATPGASTTQALNLAALVAGETLVGIDFRPQTGQFYALGINHNTEQGTLYLLDPQLGTITVAVAGTGSGITMGDFPDPATAGYGMDFNPTVDRLRVVTSTGLNFRINPNTGLVVGVDTAINGLPGGSTGVSATAYTNSFAQPLTGGTTTQYTLDAASNSLFIQNPPNGGVQTAQIPVTVGGNPLDFTDVNGFDIPSAVRVSTSAAAATGHGWFVATVGGETRLYRLDLATGVATDLGFAAGGATPLAGLTVFTTPAFVARDDMNTLLSHAVDTIDFGDVGVPGEIQGNLIDDDGDGTVDEVEFVDLKSVSISNNGSQPLAYAATTTTTDFSVVSNPSGVIPAGGSTRVEVAVAPSSSGVFADTLTITTNDPVNAEFEVELTATAFLPAVDDAAVVTTGDTLLTPLSNDGLHPNSIITAVSDPAIIIGSDGRTLFIPASFGAGSFTYTADDGSEQAKATVNVTVGTPVVAPVAFSGLLYTANGTIVGSANVTLSASGVATVKLLGGTGKATTKITVATVGSSGANFTPLGYVRLERRADGTLVVGIAALGGDIGGTLLPVQKTATVAKHHIALTGGGFAIAAVSAKGAIKITGLLPDGVPFSATSALRDNSTFAFYATTKGPKPPTTIGGQLTVANLAKTDVSGSLQFLKQPQLPGVKGLLLFGVNAILTANGSLYDGTAPLPTGNGTLKLTGGDLAADESNAVIVSAAGIPTPAAASALKTWTGVKIKVGKFNATVAVPTITKPVKGKGLYLPKSNSAWGFFPGTTIGGSIELTVP